MDLSHAYASDSRVDGTSHPGVGLRPTEFLKVRQVAVSRDSCQFAGGGEPLRDSPSAKLIEELVCRAHLSGPTVESSSRFKCLTTALHKVRDGRHDFRVIQSPRMADKATIAIRIHDNYPVGIRKNRDVRVV